MTYEPWRDEPAAPTTPEGPGSTGGAGASAAFSDARTRLAGGATQAKDGLLKGFSRVVDGLEGQIHKAPADIQPAARKAVGFARERPFATMIGLAAAALVLTRGARRR